MIVPFPSLERQKSFNEIHLLLHTYSIASCQREKHNICWSLIIVTEVKEMQCSVDICSEPSHQRVMQNMCSEVDNYGIMTISRLEVQPPEVIVSMTMTMQNVCVIVATGEVAQHSYLALHPSPGHCRWDSSAETTAAARRPGSGSGDRASFDHNLTSLFRALYPHHINKDYISKQRANSNVTSTHQSLTWISPLGFGSGLDMD